MPSGRLSTQTSPSPIHLNKSRLERLGQRHTKLLCDRLPLRIPHHTLIPLTRRRRVSALSQHSNTNDVSISRIPKAAAHAKNPIRIRKRNQRSQGLLNSIALVQIQTALRITLSVWRDDKDKVLFAQLGGGVCGGLAQGQDAAAANVDGDVRVVDVVFGHPGAGASDGFVGGEIVKDVVGEVECHARAVFGHGAHEEAVAEQKLVLDGEGICVFWVREE